jgi:hypothetical protein
MRKKGTPEPRRRRGDECDVTRSEYEHLCDRLYRLEDTLFALERLVAPTLTLLPPESDPDPEWIDRPERRRQPESRPAMKVVSRFGVKPSDRRKEPTK